MERRGSRLSRRAFVVGVAGLWLVAGCERLPGQAPTPKKTYRVGYLGSSPDLLRDSLQELGYVEGKNLVFEYRRGGSAEQAPTNVAEVLSLRVDVLVVASTEAA